MRKICYYPELVNVAGSVTGALMMSQLEFWFKVRKGKSFYKFLQPCMHELYKVGDSWQEELSMSPAEVRSAFKRIGVMYKSKRSFESSGDIFQGKLYAAYYDRIRRTTHYFRNTKKVEEILRSLETSSSLVRDMEEDKCTQVNDTIECREDKQEGVGNLEKLSSEAEKSLDGLIINDFIQDNKQDNQLRQHKESLTPIPYVEICELYNDYLGETLGCKTMLSPNEKQGIKQLWERSGETLEFFKRGFMKVAASPFLCGKLEGKKWRASLEWLMKENHLSQVVAGKYDDYMAVRNQGECMNRSSLSPKVKAFNQMYSHDWDFEEIERLERLYIDNLLMGKRTG